MKKTNWKIVKRKIAVFIFAALMAVFSITTDSFATIAPATFSTGHITYSSGAYNIGNYSTTLSTAVSSWNNAINANGCSNNISLTAVTSGDVIVSFTSSYNNTNVLGRVSLYATDIYGDLYSVNLTDATQWESGFLYVYPAHIIAAVNQSNEFDASAVADCIKKTTVHEFGHILGLMHPTDGPASSVMYQGLSTTFTPSAYDKDQLCLQWCI